MKISRLSAATLLAGVFILFIPTAWAASEEGVTVSSDSLRIQESTGEIRFEGSVEALLPNGVLNCDLLTVRADTSDPSRIMSGVATGKVVLTRDGDRIEAQKALFDLETGNVKLTGSPQLIRKDTTIQAETITYSMDQGTVSFSGPVKALFRKSGEEPR